ncbi:hypothetical protein RHMOL_Rhmol03G0273600 [Rhododendron molle]|uniref:Uncharacterized protein n=1 Tax=Rhododendron molle TaxID=49168 RepID=A0ACC0PJB4_RHOML|nr:hypothetical protein RHMOL_Rhmol03G0273600 [Rhododendron molle]
MVVLLLDWAWDGNGSPGRPNGAYGVTVGSVVVCGLANGLIGGSLVGFAGKLPKQYMQAVFAGTFFFPSLYDFKRFMPLKA